MTSPLVSILIPCYNAAPHLKQCIESALNQTYTNKEIILLDDGSTDESLAIASNFGNLITVKSQPNKGCGSARNRLFELSKGEWIQYLDADDYLLPSKIAGQLKVAIANPTDICIDSYKIIIGGTKSYLLHFPSSDILGDLTKGIGAQTNSFLIKRSVLDRVKWSSEYHNDLWFLLDVINAGFKTHVTKEVSSVHRKNWSPHQITSQNHQLRFECLQNLKSNAINSRTNPSPTSRNLP